METQFEIDTKTLEDLNILPESNPHSLLGMLNARAKTTDAKQLLKNIVLSPMGNVRNILNRQSDMKFILQNIGELSRIRFDDACIYTCRDYLNSNIIALLRPGRFLAFTNSFSYGKFIPALKKGVMGFRWLTPQLQPLHFLVDLAIPLGLRKLFADILIFSEKVANSEIGELLHQDEFSDTDVLMIDSVLRGSLIGESRNFVRALIMLDAYIALARFQADFNLKFPDFKDCPAPVIKVLNLRNPMITNCKPIDLDIGEWSNLIYLTGPNMSGKSSLLRAFGGAVFLAHLGMGVPADEMTLTLFDGIIADITNQDNPAEGQSYFLSEVLRVKTIAQRVVAGKKFLIICDELFRGTNVLDATECTRTVVNGFINQKDSMFLIASHIYDIKTRINDDNAVRWLYFESWIENDKPVFSYVLKEGISDQRYGLLLLKNNGVCDLLSNGMKTRRAEGEDDSGRGVDS